MGSAIILAEYPYPGQKNRIESLTKMYEEARDSLRHYLALIRNFPEFARAETSVSTHRHIKFFQDIINDCKVNYQISYISEAEKRLLQAAA